MRKFYTTLIFAAALISNLHGQDTITPINYAAVVQVDSIPREVLFSTARKWFSEEFADYKSIVQFEDKEEGVITVKAIIYTKNYNDEYLYGQFACNVRCQISIYVKDGKYRYEFSNFIHDCIDNGQYKDLVKENSLGILTNEKSYTKNSRNAYQKLWNETILSVDANVQDLINSLKKAMSSPIKNW